MTDAEPDVQYLTYRYRAKDATTGKHLTAPKSCTRGTHSHQGEAMTDTPKVEPLSAHIGASSAESTEASCRPESVFMEAAQ